MNVAVLLVSLLAGETAGYIQRGKLDEACRRFGIAYDTARAATAICRAIKSDMRISDLTFAHHQVIAGRTDAPDLLQWAVSFLGARLIGGSVQRHRATKFRDP